MWFKCTERKAVQVERNEEPRVPVTESYNLSQLGSDAWGLGSEV